MPGCTTRQRAESALFVDHGHADRAVGQHHAVARRQARRPAARRSSSDRRGAAAVAADEAKFAPRRDNRSCRRAARPGESWGRPDRPARPIGCFSSLADLRESRPASRPCSSTSWRGPCSGETRRRRPATSAASCSGVAAGRADRGDDLGAGSDAGIGEALHHRHHVTGCAEYLASEPSAAALGHTA